LGGLCVTLVGLLAAHSRVSWESLFIASPRRHVATGLCTPEFAHRNFESTLDNKAGAAATRAEKEQKVFEFPVLGPIR